MSEIKVVELVEILPMRIWVEKDFCGVVHIKMQHQGHEAFTFIRMGYDYAYTSNSHQHHMTQEILKLLGVTDEQALAKQDSQAAGTREGT